MRETIEAWMGIIFFVSILLGMAWVLYGYPYYAYNQCINNPAIIKKELCKEFLE